MGKCLDIKEEYDKLDMGYEREKKWNCYHNHGKLL
jgi:hypothetical protein